MRFKVRMKLDMTISDDKYSNMRKHERKNPIGPSIEIEGTLDEIKEEICSRLDKVEENLKKWSEGREEEIYV